MVNRNVNIYSGSAVKPENPDSELRGLIKRRENSSKNPTVAEKHTASETTSQTTKQKETSKKATGAEIVKNAVYSGLNQFNQGLASTLDFLLPTEFLGKYDVFSNLNDYYSGLADKYGGQLEESVSDRSKAVQVGAKLLENTTAAAPNALLAVMSGGSSAAARGSTAALTATSAAVGKTAAANAIQQTVKNPLYWSSVAQTLGNSYESVKANGASEPQAIGSAFASSLLNAAVETGGGLETLPNVLKQGSPGPATAWAKSALTEGLEEPVQSAVSGTAEKLFFDRDKPLVSLSDRSAVINPGRMAEEFAAGAAVGGILGAGQLAGTRLAAADPMARARQGDYSGLIQELDDLIQAKKRNDLLMEYEKNTGNTEASGKTQNTLNENFNNTENVLLETDTKNDKLLTGAKGAYNDTNDPNGKQRESHAERYYLSLRNSSKQNIIDTISKNSGIDGSSVSKMFDHLVVNEYDLDGGYTHFDPDYYIAESLQRLREGKNIQKHDIVLIQHEAMEYDLMNEGGLNYEDAHAIANESFNYHQALIEWLQKEGK